MRATPNHCEPKHFETNAKHMRKDHKYLATYIVVALGSAAAPSGAARIAANATAQSRWPRASDSHLEKENAGFASSCKVSFMKLRYPPISYMISYIYIFVIMISSYVMF